MAKTTHNDTAHIGALEDELKAVRQMLDEARRERDEGRDTIGRMRERLEDNGTMIESWIEAFAMERGDDGKWHWNAETSTVEDYEALLIEHNALVKRWNKLIARVHPQDVGRPLGADDEQVAQVLALRKEGVPYRLIMDETGLGLQTVRTICGRKERSDRTTVKRMIKHMPDEAAERNRAKARKRTRDALPKRIEQALAEGAELVTEAKGLGRAAKTERE